MGKSKEINLHAMPILIDNSTLQQNTWFKAWFDSAYYHKLYQNHNDQEASAFINALLPYLQPAPGSRMLDLGCGKGRHSKYLAQKGFDVTGLDLSVSSIHEAKKWQTPTLRFYRHDMRDRFGTASYDYIFSFFTSFGYFNNWAENDMVVANMAAALKRNGTILLDYLNTPYVEKSLVAIEEKEIDGTLYRINRWSTRALIYKQIIVFDPSLPHPLEYVEKVARYSTHDFERFFAAHGLKTVQFFGDYDLSDYHPDDSKRLIVLAKKVD
jgi:2-polyprenyl-3-methyl-5-hydroxy-6-metoxy-1,4-benzoquinol methylase